MLFSYDELIHLNACGVIILFWAVIVLLTEFILSKDQHGNSVSDVHFEFVVDLYHNYRH